MALAASDLGIGRLRTRVCLYPSLAHEIVTSSGLICLLKPANLYSPAAVVRVMKETLFFTFAVTFASATGAPRASLTKPKYDGPSSWWSSSSPSISPPANAPDASASEARSDADRTSGTSVMGADLPQEVPSKKIAKDHHHRHRDGPRPAGPQAPRDGLRQPGGHCAGDRCDDARGRQPAEPVHRGAVLGLLHPQPPLVDRWVIREQREVPIDADHVGDRERGGEYHREDRERGRPGHNPTPGLLLTRCPVRKFPKRRKPTIPGRAPGESACPQRRG